MGDTSNMLSRKLVVCVCVLFSIGIEAFFKPPGMGFDYSAPWWTPPRHRAVNQPVYTSAWAPFGPWPTNNRITVEDPRCPNGGSYCCNWGVTGIDCGCYC